MRMVSLIVTLVVLGLLIFKARDPSTWAWLTNEKEVAEVKPVVQRVAAEKVGDKSADKQPEGEPRGPTDLDVDEQAAAQEQFQAISDGAAGMAREEMPAYWRLFKWAESQSLAELQKRADAELQKRANHNIVLNQFVQTPDDQRGKLFSLDLNVRRVLVYDAPANSAGIKQVYEVWGWTTESKAWLYVVLTAHLPEGMPIGPNVYERATFAGYFFKVQGYQAAGAGPKDKPLAAPLFIGRLSWKPSAAAAPPPSDLTWLWWLGGVAVLFGAARLGLWVLSNRRPSQRPVPKGAASSKAADVRGWLAEVGTDALDARVIADGEYSEDGPARGANGSLTGADFRNN